MNFFFGEEMKKLVLSRRFNNNSSNNFFDLIGTQMWGNNVLHELCLLYRVGKDTHTKEKRQNILDAVERIVALFKEVKLSSSSTTTTLLEYTLKEPNWAGQDVLTFAKTLDDSEPFCALVE